MNILRGMPGKDAGEEAFENVFKYVKQLNHATCEVLEARRDVGLAFHRLKVPATLDVAFFFSTNHLENVMGKAGGAAGRLCRWHDETNQVSRWMAVALLRARRGADDRAEISGSDSLGKLFTGFHVSDEL